MNAFEAESAAWRIKSLAQDMIGHAHDLALAVKRGADPDELWRRITPIAHLAIGVEKAADAFEAALKEPAL